MAFEPVKEIRKRNVSAVEVNASGVLCTLQGGVNFRVSG